MVKCRLCGHKISLRNKREHFNRMHDECDTEINRTYLKALRSQKELNVENFTVDECIEMAAMAVKLQMNINTYIAVKLASKNSKKTQRKTDGSKYKFVQYSPITNKPWLAEVRISDGEYVTFKRFDTEEAAMQHVIDVTGLRKECLVVLKGVRLPKETKKFMFNVE
jgi:hypothetical protein